MPCNYNHRELCEKVKEGIRAAGATPIEVNTIAITDGITMGTEGMKASLVSRDLIADSVELVAAATCSTRWSQSALPVAGKASVSWRREGYESTVPW